VDAALVGGEYFIQRLYAGVPPESQTSRDLKERYGLLAYAITLPKQVLGATESDYQLTVDGQDIRVSGIKCYIVNSGRMGTGLTVDQDFSPTDGILDVFVVSKKPLSIMSSEARFLRLPTWDAGLYYWRGREITIDAQPVQAIWMDGEHQGNSPVTAQVIPGALAVVAP
jgi:diacylglycerol kinase family enzyme